MKHEGTKNELLWSPKQAAEALGVSPRKLWAMTFQDSPGLPYIRLGRLVRYPVEQLDEWIDERVKGGHDDEPRC